MGTWELGLKKENGVERDRHQSGLTKRYKEIEVDRQKIEKDIGQHMRDRLRLGEGNWKRYM